MRRKAKSIITHFLLALPPAVVLLVWVISRFTLLSLFWIPSGNPSGHRGLFVYGDQLVYDAAEIVIPPASFRPSIFTSDAVVSWPKILQIDRFKWVAGSASLVSGTRTEISLFFLMAVMAMPLVIAVAWRYGYRRSRKTQILDQKSDGQLDNSAESEISQ